MAELRQELYLSNLPLPHLSNIFREETPPFAIAEEAAANDCLVRAINTSLGVKLFENVLDYVELISHTRKSLFED